MPKSGSTSLSRPLRRQQRELVDRIKQDCEPLRHFPLAAPARENFAPGLRVSFSGNYAIYYMHDEHAVVVIRILHGARDAAALAEHGGFAEG